MERKKQISIFEGLNNYLNGEFSRINLYSNMTNVLSRRAITIPIPGFFYGNIM